MNILVVHNSYKQPGGEDVVVAQETRLLQRNGHRVATYTRSNREIDDLSFVQRITFLNRSISAADSKIALRKIIQESRPDVVHVHNTFLMISPSIYEACQNEDVPVVQTLHNYRLLCPAATFYRDGKPCEECLTHNLFRSVWHGCYRDSHVISGVVSLMLKTHRSRQTWNNQIEAYIAISSFLRQKFVEAGFPADRLHVKPNFVDPDPGVGSHPGEYALYLGRLSAEKGVTSLLEAWERLPAPIPLVIAGDGPIRELLEKDAKNLSHIRFVGQLERAHVYDVIKKAAFLVVPSLWYEPFGLVIAEAFACGVPIVGAFVGALQDMIKDNVTGLHFRAGDADDLASKVNWAWTHPSDLKEMGKAARRDYEGRYTAAANYRSLMNIYASAIDTHVAHKQRMLGAAA